MRQLVKIYVLSCIQRERVIVCDSSLRCCLWHVLRQHALSAYCLLTCLATLFYVFACHVKASSHNARLLYRSVPCVCLFLQYATLRHIVICERCCHVCGDWSLDWAIRQFRRVAKQFDDNVTMLCLAVPCIA